ncbi:lipase [Sphingomonas sp. So64.6b]|uniref:SGNH/GDSL hydrolase family protein n=1 Tax=Sphingomonas sp. So64.6b TaxID=2997354 RepID=UPI0016005DF7|nr:SGNH/GDSL hydrolase family protein [Sphingomonas sp. So64.6b]QNA85281.1 lipase [Sphingomonas sp. So64.6b]
MTEPDLVDVPITPQIVRGALELERTAQGLLPHRLPAWARAQCPDAQLAMAEAQPSGVRLAFHTTATIIELDTLATRRVYVGAPRRPDGVYDLLIDGRLAAQASAGGGKVLTIDMSTGSVRTDAGPASTLRFADLPGGPKHIEIWLPHNETTEIVALRANAAVTPAVASGRRAWLHHGSSISQGSDAASPTGIWPTIAALRAGVELTNLGLGGNALLDPFIARIMRDTPAELISLKLGINLVNTDLMRLRAFAPAVHGLLDTIRDGHPDTPLLIVSPILCPIHEDTPGPSAFDMTALADGRLRFYAAGDPTERAAGKLTLNIIRDTLERIVDQRAKRDPAIHYLDGRKLYGAHDCAERPLPDELHPDAATHRRIGERFADLAYGESGPFSN